MFEKFFKKESGKKTSSEQNRETSSEKEQEKSKADEKKERGIKAKEGQKKSKIKEEICQSCGRPMKKPEDHGGGDINNPYCSECTDEQGHLKPRDVVKKNLIDYYISLKQCSWDEAETVVEEILKRMPAWKNKENEVKKENNEEEE